MDGRDNHINEGRHYYEKPIRVIKVEVRKTPDEYARDNEIAILRWYAKKYPHIVRELASAMVK